MVSVLSFDDVISSKSTSTPSTKIKNLSSCPFVVASNTDLGTLRVSKPSFVVSTEMISAFASTSGMMLVTYPDVI